MNGEGLLLTLHCLEIMKLSGNFLRSCCFTLVGVSVLAMPQLIVRAASSAAQLQIAVELPQSPNAPTWWQQISGFLGLRSVGSIHPAVGTTLIVQASAYAPSPYQTDSTPCITAAGTRVRPGVVATNFLPLGTILDINGEKYIVEDRMSPRYAGYYLDVWFPSTSEALVFGRQGLSITIVGYGQPGQDVRQEKNINDQSASTAPKGFFGRITNGVNALTDGLATFIGVRSPEELNKHDVNCFSDDVLNQE